MPVRDDIEELDDDIYEDVDDMESEETVEVKKKDSVPAKGFSAFIREYQKAGYSVRESMEMAYRKMHPLPKQKMFDLYCMSFFPDINLDAYKDSYILVGNELKYITLNGKYEAASVPITNMDVFLSEISNIDAIVIEKRHFSNKQIKDLITLNGGHTRPKIKKPSKKKVDESENKVNESEQ